MIFKIISMLVIFLILFCVISLIIFNKDINEKKKTRQPIEYVKISSETIYGEKIDSSIFSDKTFTVVNIWATYCSSCINELEYLQEIYDEFKNHNIGFLGIVSDLKINNYKDKDLKKAISVVKKNNVKYPNIFADEEFVNYFTGKLFFIPTTIIVDDKGNVIRDIIESAYSKDEYIEIIKKVLDNNVSFNLKNSGLVCSIDGKCEKKY